MKIEDFNSKLIDNVFLGSNLESPYDSTIFISQQKDEICQISGLTDFDILHIELPQELILCDGYYIDEGQGKLSVLIGDISKNKKNAEVISNKELEILIEKGKSFVRNIFENTIGRLIDESEQAQHSVVDEIYESSLRIENVNFFIITNKAYYSESDLIGNGEINKLIYSTVVISLIDFYDFWKSKTHDFITPNIDFKSLGYKLPYISLSHDYDEYKGFLVVMNARALFDIYDEHETDLLQGNVRFFLNATRKQNKGLLNTLGGSERQKFFAYNNGISATADSVDFYEENGKQYISTIDNLQIVNGGQTTATIHFFGNKNRDNLNLLDDVYLQMKLSVIKNDEKKESFIHDISRYANTQSAVTFSDLDANDLFNIEFEKYSREISIPNTHGEKWYFERKTSDYFTTGLNLGRNDSNAEIKFHNEYKKFRVIKKTELALILFAWGFANPENIIEPRPYDSALGAEKNYDKFKKYRENFIINLDQKFYQDSISKIILARKLTLIVNESGIKQQRNHVVNYSMGLLSLLCDGDLKFDYIWNLQDISSELSRDLAKLVKKVWTIIQESAGPINIGTWCRKPECWLEVKKINHVFLKNIPELILNPTDKTEVIQSKNTTSKSNSVSNYNSISLSFEESLNDYGFWFSMAKWAKEKNILDGASRKFVFQVGAYYISKGKSLSDKQLAWALKCYNETTKLGYNQPEIKKKSEFYIKLITNQDINRTPSISKSAAENYFNLNLDNGESCDFLFKYNNENFQIEINKRQTRLEYRFFINKERDRLKYDEGDILLFKSENDIENITVIKKSDNINADSHFFDKIKEIMGNNTHLIIDQSLL